MEDNFVAVKAPGFYTVQQGMAWRPQKVQFKTSKFHSFSTNFNKA
jgi:hypothetical protein